MTDKATWQPTIAEHDLPVIMVAGRTGVGKSALINHMFGQAKAEVGACGAVTTCSEAFCWKDLAYFIDTRGLAEVRNAQTVSLELLERFIQDQPDVILYCMDGSEKAGIDQDLAHLEEMLIEAFDRSRVDPAVVLVATKVDLIEPPGRDCLPKTWPPGKNPSEKARFIQERTRQIRGVAEKIMQVSPRLICPIVSEWYEGAKPWNLEELQGHLRTYISEAAESVLDSLSMTHNQLITLLQIEISMVRSDIAATGTDADCVRKERWLTEFVNTLQRSIPEFTLNQGLAYPESALGKANFFLELCLFEPYISMGKDKGAWKYDVAAWGKTLENHLPEIGVSVQQVQKLHTTFKEHLKRWQSTFSWKKVAVILAGTIGLGLAAFWAAPFIGGLIGGLMGFHGVVAVNAGLAWLGLGSLAAGGFGMAGGAVVLVGTGAVLGAGSSAALLAIFSSGFNADAAAFQAARALTLFDEVILPERNSRQIKAYLQRFKHSIAALESAAPDEPKVAKEYAAGLAVMREAYAIMERGAMAMKPFHRKFTGGLAGANRRCAVRGACRMMRFAGLTTSYG